MVTFLESDDKFCEDLLADSLSFDTKFFFLPVLKSVSYHPPPFNLKEGADTSLLRVSFSQFGHLVLGLSLNFYISSNSYPQFEHL